MNHHPSLKKICLIIHSLGIGGMERVMAQLANHFTRREGVSVHLVLIGINRNIEYPIHSSINVHRPSFTFKNNRRTLDTIRTMQFIRSEIKKIDPNVLLSFGEYWNNLVLLSLYGLRYPVYISDRSQPAKDLGSFQNLLRNKLYPTATGFIAQTDAAKSVCLSKKWNGNVKVIGNPIKMIELDDTIQKKNLILTVGRLIRTKHVDQLITIFSELNPPGWKLVIVGGDAKKLKLSVELKKLIMKLGMEDRVFLEGEQKDIHRYYNQARIFAFTSSSEGYPNAVGEALSAGVPVVAYDCVAGPSEMIRDGKNGFLVPLFDREMFKKKLQLLIDDEQLRNRLGNNAKMYIGRNSAARIADQFYSFISGEKVSEEKHAELSI